MIIILKLISIILLIMIPISMGKGITIPFGMLSLFSMIDCIFSLSLNLISVTSVLCIVGLVFVFQEEINIMLIGYLTNFISLLPVLILSTVHYSLIFVLYLLVSICVILLCYKSKKESIP